MRNADVFFQEFKAGRLEETATGFRFKYDADYLRAPHAHAISLRLPLRPEPYDSQSLFPFFDGLIPEGWYLDIISKTLKIDSEDRFGILLATAWHAVGAVSVREGTKV